MAMLQMQQARPATSAGGSQMLEGNVGYVQIKSMADDAQTLRGIADAMHAFRDASGLVIDVRGNGGARDCPFSCSGRI